MADTNLARMFFDRARKFRDQTRYRVKRDGSWRDVSWAEHERVVKEVAAGLVAKGIAPETRVAVLANTRPEWMEADFAILAANGLTIPIYPSNLPAECGYILHNSKSRACIAENADQTVKILEVVDRGFDLHGVRGDVELDVVVQIDGEPAAEGVLSWEDLRRIGADALESGAGEEIERRADAAKRDDLATIVYTSGTTGPPKGVPQTHGNHLAMLESLEKLGAMSAGKTDFAYLPMAHSFGRANGFLSTYIGTTTAFAQGIPTIADDIRETRPHFVPSVPRIFEKIYGRIQARREGMSLVERTIFDTAVAIGQLRSPYVERKQTVPPWVEWPWQAADALVFSKVREQLGGRIEFMISGGAPLARDIQRFFHAAGVLVLEGYGLTETCPTLTANTPEDYRFGTVGKPIDGVELRFADDGEILARGPNVITEYYERPDATEESFSDGWFHTGDIGEIDEDGFVRITDRKKDLLKTSGGKYVAPQKVENLLKTKPLVSQAVVIGDNKKYCTALLTLDSDDLREFAKREGLSGAEEEWPQDPKVEASIQASIDEVNRELASYESIKYFRVLPRDFSTETGELTPSLKVKRKVVGEKYASVIESMYA